MIESAEKSIPIDHLHTIYNYVNRIASKFRFDEHTCMDVTQEIMMKVYLKSSSFTGKAQLKTWIYSVARNHCINYKKRIYDKNPVLIDSPDFISFSPGSFHSYNSEEYFLMKSLKKILSDYVHKLPEHLKQPLVYFYYGNLKYSEISQKMGIPIGTVKSRINTAKGLLRNKLEKHVR
ncbi:MAG: sigma-70 family RNA polymerase sigma factor [Spirochaetales bacterium]|nr:sigma-70 family RNA polymerase sigma factor [Spirochaetales bacterium]